MSTKTVLNFLVLKRFILHSLPPFGCTPFPMNVVFVGRKGGRVKHLDLRHPLVVGAAVGLVLVIVGGAFSIGMGLGARNKAGNTIDQLGGWSAELLREQAQIEDVRHVLQEKVNALAMRVGQMNANVIRL